MKLALKRCVLFGVPLVVVLCGFFFSSIAEATGSANSVGEPKWIAEGAYYEVATLDDLLCLAEWVNSGKSADKKYVQVADIDLSGDEWTPIGTSETNFFKGHFDGNGKTISNLSIKNFTSPSSGKNFAGFFGYVRGDAAKSVSIRNVRLVSADIGIDHKDTLNALCVGALAGEVYNASVENCMAQGGKITTTSRSELYAGGLVGKADGRNAGYTSLEKCLAVSSISANSGATTALGGLVGYIKYAELGNCTAKTDVNLTRSDTSTNVFGVGGLIGRASNTVTLNVASYGEITVIGSNNYTYVGGMTGQMYQAGANSLTTSLSRASLSAPGASAGGLLGRAEGAKFKVENCDWHRIAGGVETGIGSSDTANQNVTVPGIDGTTLANKDYFIGRGWNFDGVWSYSPLDRLSTPNLAFIFANLDGTTLNRDIYGMIPRFAEFTDGSREEGEIFSAYFEPEAIMFDVAKTLEVGGVHFLQHPTSPSRFVISADGYVIEASHDVEIAAVMGGFLQTPMKFSLVVNGNIEITTGELPRGKQGEPYASAIEIKNADGNPTFRCVGTMPPGLNIAADTGSIYGTPAEGGDFALVVEVSDSRHTVRKNFALTIEATEPEGGGENETDNEIDEEIDEKPQTESMTNILAEVNEQLDGISVGVTSSAPLGYTAIGSANADDCTFSATEKPALGNLGDGFIALANSFRVSIPLDGKTDGDALALSYGADLDEVEGFEEWRSLASADRAELLDSETNFIYEFPNREDDSRFALLLGENGLTSWRDALESGIARMTPSGITVNYAVVDGDGEPYLDGEFIVVPDGKADSVIEDPAWLVASKKTEPTPPPATRDGSGAGCTSGNAVICTILAVAGCGIIRRWS